MNTADIIAEPLNGEDVRIDLVFVHGLSDDWHNTWGKDGRSWIQDFLPRAIPHARIFTCGFNTQHGSERNTSLSMQGLEDYEKKRDYERRPVIFLAHSLGGLILQGFLQKCTLPLRTSTKGIVFFSTPKCFEKKDRRTGFTSAMAKISRIFEDEYLSYLGSISESFPAWLNDRPLAKRVVCFYECQPVTDDLTVFKKESSVLPGCDARGLLADHMNMAAFSSTSDANYQIVLLCLKSMYCLVDESMRVLLRHSLKAIPRGRLANLPTTPDGCEEIIVSTQGTPEIRDMVRLALVAEDQGHYSKAEEKHQAIVDLLSSAGKCSSAVKELGHLSVTHAPATFSAEVERKFEKVSAILRNDEAPGRDDATILYCIHRWACLMYGRGRYMQAELYSRCCSEARIKLYGKGSTSTLLTTANWISCMMSLGKYQEARNTIQDALENEDLTISNNVSAVHVLGTYAKLAADCGYRHLAESLSCDVLRKAIHLHGYDHPYTLNRMSDLAAILAADGNLSSAEALSRRCLDGLEQTLGNDHPDCLKAARRLADYICFQQRYDDAILRHEQILAKQRLRIGNQHPETLLTTSSLGIDFALQQYFGDAENTLRLAHNGLETCLGSDNEDTRRAVNALRSVQESQEEQIPGEETIQTHLLKKPTHQQNSTSDHDILEYSCNPSPFHTLVEDEVLQAVVQRDEAKLTSILIHQNVSQNVLGRALREAAASSCEPIFKILLNFNAPVNVPSGFHGSALQAASLAGSKTLVELLLVHKADINQEGGILGNALRAAIFGGHEGILCHLLASVPPCGLLQSVLDTSIQLALRTEDMAMIGHLMKAGADINAKDTLFGSPLQQASFFGQEEIIQMLLASEADINMRGGILASPLRAAIETQNESAIKQLLGAGAIIRSNSAEKLPEGHISGDEREILAKILLNRLADSLPFRSLSFVSGSYDPMQLSKPRVMDPAGLTGPGSRSEAHEDSKNSASKPTVSGIMRPPYRASTIKRMFEFKGGGSTDIAMETRPKRKEFKGKPKRRWSQLLGRKPNVHV